MKRYRVWMSTVPAMCRTYYDGKVDVVADSYDEAVEEAIRRAAKVHGHSEFNVKKVEVRHGS